MYCIWIPYCAPSKSLTFYGCCSFLRRFMEHPVRGQTDFDTTTTVKILRSKADNEEGERLEQPRIRDKSWISPPTHRNLFLKQNQAYPLETTTFMSVCATQNNCPSSLAFVQLIGHQRGVGGWWWWWGEVSVC